jgi:hypothetical protein
MQRQQSRFGVDTLPRGAAPGLRGGDGPQVKRPTGRGGEGVSG